MSPRHTLLIGAVLTVALGACRGRATTSTESTPSPSPAVRQPTAEEIAAANDRLGQLADQARSAKAGLTYEAFKASVYREPLELGGKYIVNGDTPLLDEKHLREFYEKRVLPPQPTRLVVNQVGGMDTVWGPDQKRRLSYCVSVAFGARHGLVVQEMETATGEWEKSTAVDFVHDAAQDASCGPGNAAVVFDVRPVDVNGKYLARAFFPNEPRAARNVLVDESALTLPPGEKLQLGGVLRHELGHTLGFRHEHTRPDSGACFEDSDWRPLTSYDAFSVMHYPQCNGKGDWALKLTGRDRNGAACLYGAAPGFTLRFSEVANPAKCMQGQSQTSSFPSEIVAIRGKKTYGPYAVQAGSAFTVTIGGPGASGDPDLYVRFDKDPEVDGAYDCRPYLDGPDEICSLTVPQNSRMAHVMVYGFAAGRYRLDASYVPPTQ